MAFSQNPTSGFAGFPREIRDMVFAEVATAARFSVDEFKNTSDVTLEVIEGYTGCIKMLHEWASRSHIAKAACEQLWERLPFRRKWYSSSNVIPRLRSIPLCLLSRDRLGGTSERIRLGTIDLRSYLRKLSLWVHLNLDDPWYPNFEDQENLYKLGQELAKLARFPRLRKLRINVLIPLKYDTLDIGMMLVESLAQPCRELRRQLRTGFNLTLFRDGRRSRAGDVHDGYIGHSRIDWMLDPPTYVPRASITAGLSDVEEQIRALVEDVADPNKHSPSLQDLRAAAAKLPQKRDEILQMKEWSVGSGLDMVDWLRLKRVREHFRKKQ